MKTKMLLLAALIGAAAKSSNAGIRFGVSIGFPPPVVCSAPVAPAPVTVVQAPLPCPGVGYVWAPGYWSVYPAGRVWVPGAWHYRPAQVVHGHDRGGGHDRDRYDGHDHNGYRR